MRAPSPARKAEDRSPVENDDEGKQECEIGSQEKRRHPKGAVRELVEESYLLRQSWLRLMSCSSQIFDKKCQRVYEKFHPWTD